MRRCCGALDGDDRPVPAQHSCGGAGGFAELLTGDRGGAS